MKRGSFFKSLAALIAAPAILADVDFARPPVASPKMNGIILSDLKLVTPSYYKEYLEKYCDKDFHWLVGEMGRMESSSQRFLHYNSSTGEVKYGPPVSVTVTINK